MTGKAPANYPAIKKIRLAVILFTALITAVFILFSCANIFGPGDEPSSLTTKKTGSTTSTPSSGTSGNSGSSGDNGSDGDDEEEETPLAAAPPLQSAAPPAAQTPSASQARSLTDFLAGTEGSEYDKVPFVLDDTNKDLWNDLPKSVVIVKNGTRILPAARTLTLNNPTELEKYSLVLEDETELTLVLYNSKPQHIPSLTLKKKAQLTLRGEGELIASGATAKPVITLEEDASLIIDKTAKFEAVKPSSGTGNFGVLGKGSMISVWGTFTNGFLPNWSIDDTAPDAATPGNWARFEFYKTSTIYVNNNGTSTRWISPNNDAGKPVITLTGGRIILTAHQFRLASNGAADPAVAVLNEHFAQLWNGGIYISGNLSLKKTLTVNKPSDIDSTNPLRKYFRLADNATLRVESGGCLDLKEPSESESESEYARLGTNSKITVEKGGKFYNGLSSNWKNRDQTGAFIIEQGSSYYYYEKDSSSASSSASIDGNETNSWINLTSGSIRLVQDKFILYDSSQAEISDDYTLDDVALELGRNSKLTVKKELEITSSRTSEFITLGNNAHINVTTNEGKLTITGPDSASSGSTKLAHMSVGSSIAIERDGEFHNGIYPNWYNKDGGTFEFDVGSKIWYGLFQAIDGEDDADTPIKLSANSPPSGASSGKMIFGSDGITLEGYVKADAGSEAAGILWPGQSIIIGEHADLTLNIDRVPNNNSVESQSSPNNNVTPNGDSTPFNLNGIGLKVKNGGTLRLTRTGTSAFLNMKGSSTIEVESGGKFYNGLYSHMEYDFSNETPNEKASFIIHGGSNVYLVEPDPTNADSTVDLAYIIPNEPTTEFPGLVWLESGKVTLTKGQFALEGEAIVNKYTHPKVNTLVLPLSMEDDKALINGNLTITDGASMRVLSTKTFRDTNYIFEIGSAGKLTIKKGGSLVINNTNDHDGDIKLARLNGALEVSGTFINGILPNWDLSGGGRFIFNGTKETRIWTWIAPASGSRNNDHEIGKFEDLAISNFNSNTSLNEKGFIEFLRGIQNQPTGSLATPVQLKGGSIEWVDNPREYGGNPAFEIKGYCKVYRDLYKPLFVWDILKIVEAGSEIIERNSGVDDSTTFSWGL